MVPCLCHVTRSFAQTGGACGTVFGFGIVVCSSIESLTRRGAFVGALVVTWVGGRLGWNPGPSPTSSPTSPSPAGPGSGSS